MRDEPRRSSFAAQPTTFFKDPAGIPVLAIPDKPQTIRRCGEVRLLWGVLENGVEAYMKYAHNPSRRGARLFREAEQWIWANDPTWICSFVSICHIIGLDPGYIRRGLTKWKNARSSLQEACDAESLDPEHPVPVVVVATDQEKTARAQTHAHTSS